MTDVAEADDAMIANDVAVIIVAAGKGVRASAPGDAPKQFRHVGGYPVIWRAAERFLPIAAVRRLIVVAAPDHMEQTIRCLPTDPRLSVVPGGETRQQSVHAGLSAVAGDACRIVLIHDAARPFVDPETIERVIAAVEPGIAVLPAHAISDTLKRGDDAGFVETTIDRARVYAAQTPQGFDFETIWSAHESARDAGRADFTDDTSVLEWHGGRTKLVEGSLENVKLTFPADFAQAEARFAASEASLPDVRTGNGYDVHRLVPGDHVTLCGVRIPHDFALDGHSDADVGLHALTDALLATCGAGDIGTHFPPSDERWRGAASHRFVRHAVEIVRRNGGVIRNVDVTLIAEAPKILPHREAMCAAMADMTGLEAYRVSVKATTNETIGFVGRREGIAAIATASVVYRPNR